MKDLEEYFKTLKYDLIILNGDIRRMLHNKKKEASAPEVGLKTMQSITNLYSSKQEIVQAKANPEADFIDRSLNKILDK